MAKTKRCRNGKMKKRNKTQKYVKSGGFLKNIRGKKKSHDKFQYLEKTESQILKMTPDDLIHNITSNLNVMKQEHNHILEHLHNLFNNLKTNYKYDKSKFGDDITQWCNYYNKPLTQYTTMKEEIHALQQKNPSLVSLIQEIQKKIKDFEDNNEHFKHYSCNPLPPTPVFRSRASTSQGAAPPPPPRGNMKERENNIYNVLKRKNPTPNLYGVPIPQRPVRPSQTNSPVKNTANIKHLLTNISPYENDYSTLPPPPRPTNKKPSQSPPPRPLKPAQLRGTNPFLHPTNAFY